MFDNLSERLERSFKILKGEGKITEINVAETLKDVRRALLDADVNYKVAKTFTDTVKQIVYIARSDEKFRLLYNHLAKYPEARTIIFCNRKFTTERISENLRRRGIACEVLSGDVNQVRRLKILEAFRAGTVRTVVATDVAGRGIHVDDIAFVVNYDFPYEPEDYVHRIGRTGRAGHTGTAISFADEDESFIIPDIEKYINEPLKCVMPEEWMYAELPAPAPRGRRRDRRPEGATTPVLPEASAQAPETSSEPVTSTVPATFTSPFTWTSPRTFRVPLTVRSAVSSVAVATPFLSSYPTFRDAALATTTVTPSGMVTLPST